MAIFDRKEFNAEAFGKYVDRIPSGKKNALAKSGAVGTNARAATALNSQTGSLYASLPYFGRISGATSQNNDGASNIQSSNTGTYLQGFVVASRMDSWTERNFSKNITAGVDFMDNVAKQISEYKDEVKQAMLLKILEGIFSMSAEGSSVEAVAAREFLDKHVYDITANESPAIGVDTLNKAMQKACGDNKSVFTLVICDSTVATNLENLSLLHYMKYNDANGVERELGIGTWNGRTVLIDDEMPAVVKATTAGVYTVTVAGTVAEGDKITVAGKEVTLDSSSAASVTAAATAVVSALGTMDEYQINRNAGVITFTEKEGYYGAGAPSASITSTAGTVTVATTTEPTTHVEHTTYVLGNGAIVLENIGDSVPYEMSRDPKTNGGEDTLYVRDRYIIGADGISYKSSADMSVSPSNDDLADGDNWEIIHNASSAVPHKTIALAKIISIED